MKRTPFTLVLALAASLFASCAATSDIPEPVTEEGGALVLVRGGTFKMGGRYGDRDETTIRKITVSTFWLSRAEITEAEFSAWKAATGGMGGPGIGGDRGGAGGDASDAVAEPSKPRVKGIPATGVEWREAAAYCNYLSEKAGRKSVYTIGPDGVVTADWAAEGYRLPTEAEFEWAASGGRYSRHYDYSGSSKAEEVAWYNGNADGPRPVKSKTANELGIHDLSGNVWEWCWDTYGEYDRRAEPADPRGPEWGDWKALRGGSWKFNVEDLRPSNRYYADSRERLVDVGFRVARRFTEADEAKYPERAGEAGGDRSPTAVSAALQAPPDNAAYRNVTLPAAARARDLLSYMTLEEKAGQMVQGAVGNLASPEDVAKYGLGSVLSGGGMGPSVNTAESWADMTDRLQKAALSARLSIPMIYGLDAVHGHNNVRGATIFPHNIGLGAANDPVLMERIGRAVAEELKATGVYWNFAPCVAVARDERWGRTYESFSETPARASVLGAAYIRGLQQDGSVAACAKHYLADGGTKDGKDRGDARIPDAELRAVHLPPYGAATEAGVRTVMASFSAVNGKRMHANDKLVVDVLRGELGFTGVLVSDWNAHAELPGKTPDQVLACVRGGIDMFMAPEGYAEVREVLIDLTERGKISMERIDASVLRILELKFALGLFESPFADRSSLGSVGSAEHRSLAREAVRKSIVLLKNEERVLPVGPGVKRIVVAGALANDLGSQCGGWTITWQGGSGPITTGTTILAGIEAAAEKRGMSVEYAAGGPRGKADADLAIAVVGESPYAEWFGDRTDLRLKRDDRELVSRIAATGVPTVLVVVSGRPILIADEIAAIEAAVAAWLPGTEGEGVADVLFGDAAPTGTLSFTWPREASQLPINDGDGTEGLFPFGFGLKYER